MFRQSGLYRDKWDRTDYREDTLTKAMRPQGFYDWGLDGTRSTGERAKPHIAEQPKPPGTNQTTAHQEAQQNDRPCRPGEVEPDQGDRPTQKADWIIKGWAEFGCLHAVTGLPFSGKSMTIADILAAMVRRSRGAA